MAPSTTPTPPRAPRRAQQKGGLAKRSFVPAQAAEEMRTAGMGDAGQGIVDIMLYLRRKGFPCSCVDNVLDFCVGPADSAVLVELCCGTKSVGKVFEYYGRIDTISIDIDAKWWPDVLADISSISAEELMAKIEEKCA